MEVSLQAVVCVWCRNLEEAERLISIGLEEAEDVVLNGPVRVTEAEEDKNKGGEHDDG